MSYTITKQIAIRLAIAALIIAIVAEAAEQEDYEKEDRQILGLEENQQHYRLLIAEDRSANRVLLRSLLEPFGFDIHEVSNGKQALEEFAKWRPHLIWMDIRMPVMSGLEATRLIKESEAGNDTVIIALTGHALEEERLEILKAGCDHLIRKPYYDYEIYHALKKYLDVSFTYGDEESVAVRQIIEINAEHLRKVPLQLLENLHEAAEQLDDDSCFEIASTISDYNIELASYIRNAVEDFNYEKLLALCTILPEGRGA